jgi:hypothetical protein
MPLLDHFHPPLSRTHPWRGFHGTWATNVARLLNAIDLLPPNHHALPIVERYEVNETDDVRVEVLTDDGDPRLAAAVELVSPRNKDRVRAREAFTGKCADYLRRGCGLVVVDVVTTRRADLHTDLLAALGAEPTPLSSSLAVVSYRAVGRESEGQLQAWPAALEVGRPLPTVPLWLAPDLAVPLDLEASHTAACRDLRITQAG